MAIVLGLFVAMIPGCGPHPPDGMALIPAGFFIMGTDEVSLEGLAEEYGAGKPWVIDATPAHRVDLAVYFIDLYEVTHGDYFRFVQETGFPVPPRWHKGAPRPEQVNLPATFISWREADTYCRWRGARLPSEAEWEKAARGENAWLYPWGNFFDYRRANIGGLYEGPKTVGSFERGRSPYGVYDMIGNVWEWTADWYQAYPESQFQSNYFGKKYRVARGNSWAGLGHFQPEELKKVQEVEGRVTYRLYFPPHVALEDIGFRCAQDFPSGK